MKLWDKDGVGVNELIEDFTVGDDYLLDIGLIPYDVKCSIAHAAMLNKAGIISDGESEAIESAFKKLLCKYDNGDFVIKKSDEDCHTAIENFLVAEINDIGKKIHTGRSRNDQVLAAFRLYMVDKIQSLCNKGKYLTESILDFAYKHKTVLMPGYTHMQKAMLSSVGLWAVSFAESFIDDIEHLMYIMGAISKSPMGSAAGYGTSLDLDRDFAAKKAGFASLQVNVLYAQNSRIKYDLLVIDALKQMMMTANKLASDMMLFTTSEFGYFSLPSGFTTGSSIMPQKKNYDLFEIMRGKSSSLNAASNQIFSIGNNLVSGYNREFQLSKKVIMDSFKTADEVVTLLAYVFENIKVEENGLSAAVTEELVATDKAYDLVKKGMPFRDAYKLAAEGIKYGEVIIGTKGLVKNRISIGSISNLGIELLKKRLDCIWEVSTKI
ncbi:argininosuccinate lyase [Candidatus Woesearchaeota archaeon CG11_big_fil_rev_8_21_14_0_20_43_8]|nr:MAG: argininosuccinate lyase [Candidatus Woesearchaeota archaeon CG11_big_fil_rev_8_21_14_0_20_43_8]PIO04537.1 MAG: argininosuccinate lyase [Candidatus Woesearchaeota archaeon CG08_land_8_20_14_0_20_43_7]